jgi:hypothetical protein
MATHAPRAAMMDRADIEIGGLEAAEGRALGRPVCENLCGINAFAPTRSTRKNRAKLKVSQTPGMSL